MTEQTLEAWVAQQLPAHKIHLSKLSGDAGARRYFRLSASQPPLMAVYAPPATENTSLYMTISQLLAEGGVRVPHVQACDHEQGFLLVEDCGDELLLSTLNTDTVNHLYEKVLAELLRIQSIQTNELPHYDAIRLYDEMALFPRWFIRELLQLPLGDSEQQMLDKLFEWLIAHAEQQPQALVHRDFHSRNLMLLGEQTSPRELVVIDFQDAVIGPVTYDLVSLLRDCYVRWPPEQVRTWALAYRQRMLASGRSAGDSDDQFLRWFDLMGLQRHIKVLGIFARLYLRDGKAGYLKELPLVLRYVMEVASQYRECAAFAEWMQASVLPACQKKPWFTAWS